MQHDSNDTADVRRRLADAARLLRRPRTRVRARPASIGAGANLMASFAVIAGLLMFWAMTVRM